MLKRENKIFYLLNCLIIFYSCSNSNNNGNATNDLKSNIYTKNKFKEYSNIYTIVNDSVKLYSDSLLTEYLHIYGEDWQIDSMICINSNYDKLVTTINSSTGIGKNCKMDEVTKLLGKKINSKWYFFEGGGTLVVPREYYGKNEMNPLTFHELSQIARKNFLESALIKNEKGEYIVNDKWIDEHFYNNGFYTFGYHKNPGMISEGEEYQMPRDKAKFDSVHWYYILHKWTEKIDTNEYKPLRKNKVNS